MGGHIDKELTAVTRKNDITGDKRTGALQELILVPTSNRHSLYQSKIGSANGNAFTEEMPRKPENSPLYPRPVTYTCVSLMHDRAKGQQDVS